MLTSRIANLTPVFIVWHEPSVPAVVGKLVPPLDDELLEDELLELDELDEEELVLLPPEDELLEAAPPELEELLDELLELLDEPLVPAGAASALPPPPPQADKSAMTSADIRRDKGREASGMSLFAEAMRMYSVLKNLF